MRKTPDLSYENQLGYPTRKIAGVDEVGRGCLAGPVVACAFVLPSEGVFEGLDCVRDSKLLSPAKRAWLDPLLSKWALAFSLGVASVAEIDQWNILKASHIAMVRAIHGLKDRQGVVPDHILIDGKHLPSQSQLPAPATGVIGGDRLCLSIAAASILAKVWRDNYMISLSKKYPGYGFEQNKGYPTALHRKALQVQGVTNTHRRSFRLHV